ncbi:MAG: hypothetical protein J5999_04085 [Oscillospiraceae bacterium]|nr:hypothetical protein [Oscillospiraceae bacterium]
MTEFFLKIIGMSITACLVGAIVLVLRALLKPAPRVFSYLLWAAVFVRLLVPFSLPLPTSEISPITPVNIHIEPYADQNANSAAPLSAGISKNMEISIYTSENIPEYKTSEIMLENLSAVWLLGVLVMTVRFMVSYFGLKRRLRTAVCLEDNIFISDNIGTPFIFGIIKPRIYIPENLPENRRKPIILHEKYHIRRLDHIAKIVIYLALCIHWFNPVVWLCFSLCERDMEMSCDEAVTGKMTRSERADYSEALLAAAPKKAVRFTAGFSESPTEKRIKNVLSFKKPALWITVFCALAAVVSVVILCSDNSPKSEDTAAENLADVPLSIPVVPASTEFLESVYFGSEFPYLLYATPFEYLFTDGMDGMYLCSDSSVLWAANIGASFEAVKDKIPFEIGGPSWNGLSMGAFYEEIDGGEQLRLWCSATGYEAHRTVYYLFDLETGMMNYIEKLPEDRQTVRIESLGELPENAPRSSDGNGVFYGKSPDEYAYLSLDNTVSEPFHLSMIKLVRHTKDGLTEFVPFPENSPAIDAKAREKLSHGN